MTRVSARRWSGSSIRSTAYPRLPRRARGLVRQCGAGRRARRRCWRRYSRPPPTNSSSRCAGRAPRATRGRCVRQQDRARFFPHGRTKPLVQRLSSSPDEITLHPRIGSLALRLCLVADGRLDAAFAGGQSRDWDLAAANLIVQEANGRMTALSGDAIVYNRREVVHGVGSSGTGSSCAHCRAFSRSSVALNGPIVPTNRPAHLATRHQSCSS